MYMYKYIFFKHILSPRTEQIFSLQTSDFLRGFSCRSLELTFEINQYSGPYSSTSVIWGSRGGGLFYF